MEQGASALRAKVTELASNSWVAGRPEFVDETDSESCTRPEDLPIRTVGVVLPVTDPDTHPGTPQREVVRFVDALTWFCRQQSVEFTVQLDETYVGAVTADGADRLLRDGLIELW